MKQHRVCWSMSTGFLAVAICATNTSHAATVERWVEPPQSVATVEMNRPHLTQGSEFDPQRLGLVSRASELVNKKVQNEIGASVGRFRDVLLDVSTGRLLGAVISTGGRDVLVPATALFPAGEKRIVFNASPAILKSAPDFRMPMDTSDPSELTRGLAHFGVTIPDTSTLKPMLAASLRGKPVQGRAGEPVGQVQDVVLDVSSGKAVYVVLKPRSGAGQLYAVPPQVFEPNTGRGTMTLKLKADEPHFLSGPAFPGKFWTEMSLPEFARSVYSHYGLLNRASDAGGTQARLTPTGRSDADIRRAVMSELVQSAPMSSTHAESLNLSVQNGRVVLAGNVSNEKARRDLIEAASRVVGSGNVEDRLVAR